MATWREFENKEAMIQTDEAHCADRIVKCDFCNVNLGAGDDPDSEFPQRYYRYFQTDIESQDGDVIGSATICQECAETFSMYAEQGDRSYREPVIKWRGEFGNQKAVHIEDLRRDDLIKAVRHLHAQLQK